MTIDNASKTLSDTVVVVTDKRKLVNHKTICTFTLWLINVAT